MHPRQTVIRASLALLLAACTPSATEPTPLETIERRVGVGEGPIVVLLHGYSSSPERFLGLADRPDLPAGTHLVFPRAPHPVPGLDHGTMWWPLPPHLDEVARERVPGMDEARRDVSALLDRLVAAEPGRPLVLGGFSQGAMVSLDVATHDPRPLAGLALLSGTMIDEARTRERLPARRGLRVFVSHGTNDEILDYAEDVRLVDAMRGNGLDVSFTSYAGGHVVTAEVSTELAHFVTRCASASSP